MLDSTSGEVLGAGVRVGDYVLEERLGAGGMGEVWAARHEATGAWRALKAVPLASSPELLERFRREGEAQARVDAHPNVARVHASGQTLGHAYLVMDLVSGGDLERRLRQGPLPVAEAVRLVVDLARGVAHAHAQGVLHRDLKPANVLFAADGTPRLVDFGLARVANAESLTQSGSLLGTPSYMAPEQARSEQADERADVYGLGALLYHALTGRPPFVGASVMLVLMQVDRDRPESLRSQRGEVPVAVEREVLRALAKAPGDRHPSATALAEALERALEEMEAPGLVAPRLWAAGGALALGLLGALLLLAARPPRAPSGGSGGSAGVAGANPSKEHEGARLARNLERRWRRLEGGPAGDGQALVELRRELDRWLARFGASPQRAEVSALRKRVRARLPRLRLPHPSVAGVAFVGSAHLVSISKMYFARFGAKLWNLETGEGRWVGPRDLFYTVDASAERIALAFMGGALWLDAKGEEVGRFACAQQGISVALAPDGRRLAFGARGGEGYCVHVLDLEQPAGQRLLWETRWPRGERMSEPLLAWDRSGRRLAIGVGSEDRYGIELWGGEDPLAPYVREGAFDLARSPVNSLVFSSDGSKLLVGDQDGRLLVVDPGDGAIRFLEPELRSGDSLAGVTHLAHSGRIPGLAIRGEALFSVSATDPARGKANDLRRWDLATGRLVGRHLANPTSRYRALDMEGERLAIACEEDGHVEVWWAARFDPSLHAPASDSAHGLDHLVLNHRDPREFVQAAEGWLDVNPDHADAAKVRRATHERRLELPTRELSHPGVMRAGFLVDGGVVTADTHELRIWPAEGEAPLRVQREEELRDVAFAQAGGMFAFGGSWGVEVRSGRDEPILRRTRSALGLSAWSLALDDHGRYLAVGESGPRILVLALKEGGSVVRELLREGQRYERAPHLALSPDGQLLAASVTAGTQEAQVDHVLVWDLSRGVQLKSWIVGQSVQSMAFGEIRGAEAFALAVGTRVGSVVVYEVDRSKPPERWAARHLEGRAEEFSAARGAHIGRVRGLQFAAEGRVLLSASAGAASGHNDVRLWQFQAKSIEGQLAGRGAFGTKLRFDWLSVRPQGDLYLLCVRNTDDREGVHDVVQIRRTAGLPPPK